MVAIKTLQSRVVTERPQLVVDLLAPGRLRWLLFGHLDLAADLRAPFRVDTERFARTGNFPVTVRFVLRDGHAVLLPFHEILVGLAGLEDSILEPREQRLFL